MQKVLASFESVAWIVLVKYEKLVCEHCGEAAFSRETTERIRRMVHGAGRPVKTVPMDVFAMA